MTTEIWKPLKYNGIIIERLLISNKGNIKNLHTNKLIKYRISKKGYYTVSTSIGNSDKITIKVHRAVAESFIDNPDNLPTVNHIDGNKLNNCVDNLEWCTSQDNIRHAIQTGLIDPYTNSRTKAIKSVEDGKTYKSIGEAGRAYANMSGSSETARKNITRALLRHGTAYGMSWIYLSETAEDLE